MKENEVELFIDLLRMQNSDAVDLKKTHISYIFFQGNRVFKLKKTIKTDFLDNSLLKFRQKNCLAELRLNRRLAPHIYLAVRPLYIGKDKRLSWQESGDIVDWVVEMLRLPNDKMLDRLIQESKVDEADLAPLASLLSRFYRIQKYHVKNLDEFWFNLYQRCQDNFTYLSKDRFSDQMLYQLQVVKAAQLSFLFLKYKMFIERKDFIVDGHGDLRPEHICLIKPPVIFDCVEFSASYRIADIIDDLAFFKLECQIAKKPMLSAYLFNHIRETGEFDPRLLAFYVSYRALVRLKVEALKARQKLESSFEACRRYLDLAYQQALSLKKPILIVVGGLSGSGKTTVSAMIAGILSARHLQSDQVRSELFEESKSRPIGYGKAIYSREKRDKVYRELLKQATDSINQGYSVVIDASFIALKHRLLVKRLLLGNQNLASAGIWCQCSDNIAISRLTHRNLLANDYSEAGPEIYLRQKTVLEKIGKDDIFRHQINTDLDVKALELKIFGMLKKQLSF